MSRTVAAGDVVVITIGANDLQPALDRWDKVISQTLLSALPPLAPPGVLSR